MGSPDPQPRDWLANLAARPEFTIHLKHGVDADLPATATVIGDPAERRHVLAVLAEEFTRRDGPDSPWPDAVLDEWVARSPLAKVTMRTPTDRSSTPDRPTTPARRWTTSGRGQPLNASGLGPMSHPVRQDYDRLVLSFGLMTAPAQVSYTSLLEVWREADEIASINHLWLYDHLMPLGGDPKGPAFEGWTLLSALAAQTRRVELGLMVTSNRFRPPALLAKMAATVDVVADGRLVLGMGVGSRPDHPIARREYLAHGLPFIETQDAVASLDEACTVIRRLWTDPEPFDFHGQHVNLTGAFANPKPVRRTPILIGGRSKATLRLVAKHADIWNIPGGDLQDCIARSALLDELCVEESRDPATITRSVALPVPYDRPDTTRAAVADAIAAGFDHVVLMLSPPYPERVAYWVAEEIIARI